MKSIWLSECDPAELRAECPHHPCGRDEAHEEHAWRGTRKAFGGAVEVTDTYWCEGVGKAPDSHQDGQEGIEETR